MLKQAKAADELLASADIAAVSLQSLRELCILSRQHQVVRADVSAAIRVLLNTENVIVNRPAVEAGLLVHDARGDFADGMIAHDGSWGRLLSVRFRA